VLVARAAARTVCARAANFAASFRKRECVSVNIKQFGAWAAMVGVLAVSGCATQSTSTQAMAFTDLTAVLNTAQIGVAAYAAQPNADPRAVATMQQMLAAAETGLIAWNNSPTPGNQAALNGLIAALISYEASVKVTAASKVRADCEPFGCIGNGIHRGLMPI
jgi:hypothetical protein